MATITIKAASWSCGCPGIPEFEMTQRQMEDVAAEETLALAVEAMQTFGVEHVRIADAIPELIAWFYKQGMIPVCPPWAEDYV